MRLGTMGGAWRRTKKIRRLALLRKGKKKEKLVRGMAMEFISNGKRRHIKRARYTEDSCSGHKARNGEVGTDV